jgi:hypothetical protein
MDDNSLFESRVGKVKCSSVDVYTFVTDIRHFEQFAPSGTINNWQAEKEFCSFSVPMIGSVSVRLKDKFPFTSVVYEGDALKKNDFILTLAINETGPGQCEVKVSLSADLNPMMKMMAVSPINQFLELLMKEMENFTGWKQLKV